MSKENDGGPAFPRPVSESKYSDDIFHVEQGMSLRDYFAGQAMIALHSSEQRGGKWTSESAVYCAKNAYELADAMLAERKK